MVSPQSPLAKKKVVRTSEIVEQPLIFPKTGFTRQMLDKLFRPYRSQIHVTMELASVGMIKAFVAANLGVSLISETFAREEARAGEVNLIPIADADLWRELGLIYRRDRTLPRAAAAFISLISRRTA
jgi:DNA-binding transcriptional LysR family regulator